MSTERGCIHDKRVEGRELSLGGHHRCKYVGRKIVIALERRTEEMKCPVYKPLKTVKSMVK